MDALLLGTDNGEDQRSDSGEGRRRTRTSFAPFKSMLSHRRRLTGSPPWWWLRREHRTAHALYCSSPTRRCRVIAAALPDYLGVRGAAGVCGVGAASRQRAMKSATDNADDLIRLPRERQAQITQEISECRWRKCARRSPLGLL